MNNRDISQNIDDALKFEKEYVQKSYDQIAPHYFQNRTKRWTFVLDFLQSLDQGSKLLDCGCGNGKYIYNVECMNGEVVVDDSTSGSSKSNLSLCTTNRKGKPIIMTSCDTSLPFLQLLYRPHYAPIQPSSEYVPLFSRVRVPERFLLHSPSLDQASSVNLNSSSVVTKALSSVKPPTVISAHSAPRNVMCCSITTLPFRSQSYDAVMSIAVIHHLASRERRIQALREMMRVVREGGMICVSAWGAQSEGDKDEEGRDVATGRDVFVPWKLANKFIASSEEIRPDSLDKSQEPQSGSIKSNKEEGSDSPIPHSHPETTTSANPSSVNDNSSLTSSNPSSNPSSNNPLYGKTRRKGPNREEREAARQARAEAVAREVASKYTVFDRYYHMFVAGELEELILDTFVSDGDSGDSGDSDDLVFGLEIVQSGVEGENYYVVVRKVRQRK